MFQLHLGPSKSLISTSNRYIQRIYTSPRNSIFLTKHIVKWIMMSKNDGGKYCSNKHNVWTISSFIAFSLDTSTVFAQIALKNKHNFVIANLTRFWSISLRVTGNNCCVNAWQSWDFKLMSLKSFIETKLHIFKD